MLSHSSKFLLSCSKVTQIPPFSSPSVAFWGRSNVGKSSLLNALLGQHQARVSHSPGRTQLLNFFAIDKPELVLVDLPGYGYAKLSKQQANEIAQLIQDYLLGERYPDLMVLLIDMRHGLLKADYEIMELLRAFNGKILVVGTKADKLSRSEKDKNQRELQSQLQAEGFTCEVLVTSSKTKAGIDRLTEEIIRHVASS